MGAHLINYFIGKQNPLIEDKKILYFFIFGAFISCLVAPTIGISTIYFQGFITTEDIPISWVTWWIGDVIGVTVFTPILLSFIAKPRSLWQERKKSVSYPLLFTFILVVGIFYFNQKQETARITSVFEGQVTKFHSTFNAKVLHHKDINEMLKGFYDSSQLVTEEEFATLTRPIIKKYQSIQTLEWISYTPSKQRNQFESAENGSLMIHEPNQDKKMIPAAERAEYFPITYLQSLENNERAIGFDVGANPVNLKALLKARDTGKTTLTDATQLIQDLEKK